MLEEQRKNRITETRKKILDELNSKKSRLETVKSMVEMFTGFLNKLNKEKATLGQEINDAGRRVSSFTKQNEAIERPFCYYMIDVVKRDDEEVGSDYLSYLKKEAEIMREERIRKNK